MSEGHSRGRPTELMGRCGNNLRGADRGRGVVPYPSSLPFPSLTFIYNVQCFRYIALPQLNEFATIEQQLQHPDHPLQRGHYRVLLFIDGFIVKIQRPDGAGDAYFCGCHGKSCDSINVQYVTDLNGRVRHVITGLSGSTHDKTAAAWSQELRAFLDGLPAGYVILGDPAYRGWHRNVISTFTGNNISPEHLSFNDACTRLRQIVERTIGASQLKWRIQQLKDNRIAAKKGVLFAARCTIAAAVLHNRFTNFL